MILHIFLLLNCIQCVWCFTINIYGDNYIEAGVPYMVTCNVSHFKEGRITKFYSKISDTDQPTFTLRHSKTLGCFYISGAYVLCQPGVCSCELDGLATHWIYNTPADLSSPVTFSCTSSDNSGFLHSSVSWTPIVTNGPGSSMSFNPSDESITKVLGQNLGSIICSAQCNPPCQFYWIKPDGTVVDGSNLQIPNLSKNDHGTFTCHTGNSYGNNATRNLLLTVNYGPESVTLSPPTTTYTVTEGDTIPSIICIASCRPQCTFMWTGHNVPDGTIHDLYLQNINRNQTGTFYCNAINEVASKVSSNVEVDVRYGPGSSISYNPADESITRIQGQSQGPIVCSAQCSPPCHFYWIKPDETVVDGSTLEIPSLSKNDHGICTCHAGNGYANNATKNLLLTVNYGPESVTLYPLNTTYTVTEGDNIPSISCTASCRPQCTFMWTGPNVPGGTTNDLYLQNITRNQNGTFYCTAINNVGSKMSSNVEVDVRYGPGSSMSFNPPDESITKVEGQSLGPIVCSAQCNPQCQFYWIKPDGTVVEGLNLEIPRLSKNDHGTFTCHAGNGYGNNATKNILLTVNCHPRSAIMLDTTIAITNKQRTLNITVPIISYPQPSLIRWTFIQNGTTYITDVDTKYITTTYGVYQHVSQLIKGDVTDSEYGTYSIKVSNHIDPDFTHDFRVVEENKPTAPTIFYVLCKTTSTVVLWRSEFNGGSKQEFYVQHWRISQSSSLMLSQSIPDSGSTSVLEYTVNNLVPDTIYLFQIIARNYLGDSLSKSLKCTTDQTQVQNNPASASQQSNILFMAGISSLIIGLLAIAFAIVFVLFCRSRIQKREHMRTNDYTEFTTCTNSNPVVTDSYDSLNTTTMGTADINGTQTDRNVDTYEECLPVTNTDHTYTNLNKQPKEKKKLKKKEEIYDNMKI